MATSVKDQLLAARDAAPLVVFRIFFGFMVLVSLVRFVSYGWVDKLYIAPNFFFSYYGFEWVHPLGIWTYGLYLLCGLASMGVLLGYRYRLSACVLFVTWTYIELMDKTHYLNHYYAISLIAFLLIWLPAASNYALDVRRRPARASATIPAWTIYSVLLMVGMIYFFAGIAKINSDWLYHAQPLRMWLPSQYDTPLIGHWLEAPWVAYTFSWAGMLFDVSIPFLLACRLTRPLAYIAVVVFHLLTWMLFPIGIFPFVMIVSATIYFSARWHKRLLGYLQRLLRLPNTATSRETPSHRITYVVVGCFMVFNVLMPFRYLLYPAPQDLFWTEYGFRYSWRVMLMEKAGYASFTVVEPSTGQRYAVDNDDFLTPIQQKQMATQVDFMIQYAHHLADQYSKEYGVEEPQVFVQSRVALNGRRSQPYVRADIDLTQLCDQLGPQDVLYEYKR